MQICRRLSIDCFCVQRTQEQAETLKSALGDTDIVIHRKGEDGGTENSEDCIEERHEKEGTDTEDKVHRKGQGTWNRR